MRQLFDPSASSFFIFPFLKTSRPISIGGHVFRSTSDSSGLSQVDASNLDTLAEMLFLQDHLRVRSSTYTAVPYIQLNTARPSRDLKALERIQAALAYCYSAPHETSTEPFLRFENTSSIVISPHLISIHLLRLDKDVEVVLDHYPEANEFDEVPAFYGLYNFRHHFAVCRGSRIYPPAPSVWLNMNQNLSMDVHDRPSRTVGATQALLGLLDNPQTEFSRRVFTAIRWFNYATSIDLPQDVAIVHLATAFETLLELPRGPNHTERFRESVNLLLGRVPRLDAWLEQFYGARSEILHMGRAPELRFVRQGIQGKKHAGERGAYFPLVSYGRQVFHLCLASQLIGAQLAKEAGLAEKLVTNQERFERLCSVLQENAGQALERIASARETVEAIDRYRFVSETNLRLATMLSCAKLAAKALTESGVELRPEEELTLRNLSSAERSEDHFEELNALRSWHDVAEDVRWHPEPENPRVVVSRLLDAVWHYVFMHYFWLTDEREGKRHG